MTKTHARATATADTAKPAPIVQRACSCGHHHAGSGPCESCRKRAAQRQGLRSEGFAPDAASLVGDIVRSEGDPLDTKTRTFFESRFGQDLGRVRVHTGARAAESARAVDAQAYTVGNHVVFDAGRFNPASGPGRELLAHELVHTLQQRGVDARDHDFTGVGVPGARVREGASEREASSIAPTVAAEGRSIARPSISEPLALRRQSNAAAATTKAPSVDPVQVVPNVNVGKFSPDYEGRADARLDRRPALGQPGDNPPPCQLDLILKLSFDFRLGAAPHMEAGQTVGEGDEWPGDRAEAWKRKYMGLAQDTWRTRTALERKGDCANEPCKRAIGQLRIIDTKTMRDSAGQPAPEGLSTEAHFPMKVYEFRPLTGKNVSRVGTTATLFAEDILPLGTPPPKGFDETKYLWTPGGAAHETGHMLGRPHVACPPDRDQRPDACYGKGEQRKNIMGKGTEFSKEDHAPFIAGMKAATNCDWEVPSGGLPWWAILLISLTVIGGIVLGIMALAGAL